MMMRAILAIVVAASVSGCMTEDGARRAMAELRSDVQKQWR